MSSHKKQRSSKAKSHRRTAPKRRERPRCGLCGATGNLTKTPCCGQWICDDEDQYVIFSFERNSCFRNHARYTLCGGHFAEGHEGRWQDCEKCREHCEPEMYAYYGTNEYNFEVLENPPQYEPTYCRTCGKVIALAEDGWSKSNEGYECGTCVARRNPDLAKLYGL